MSIRVALRGVGRAALVLAVLISPSALFAEGTQTGIVVGQVLDTSGTGVEGASVKLLGPRGERTAVSVADGLFRVPALPVGTYQVQAELPGVGLESNPKPVEVFIDRTTDVELSLVPADQATEPIALEEIEVIEVSAEAPLIDPFDARLGGNVRYEFVDELPLERFYQSVALMLPGVAGGQDGNPNVNGSLDSHNLYLIDGVDTTDPTTGLFGLNLNYEAIQEVAVTTGGFSAEYGRASGGVINVVTRSGTNRFEGSARWVATNPDWNDDYELRNVAPFLAEEITVSKASEDDIQNNFALAFGGPIVRDRLWFFAAYEQPEGSFLRPVVEGSEAWDQNPEGERQAYKLTWGVTPSHTVTGQYTADSLDFQDFQPFDSGPSRNIAGGLPNLGGGVDPFNAFPGDIFAVEARTQEGEFSTLQWNGLFGSELSVDLTLADQERDLRRAPSNSRGLSFDAPHFDLIRGLTFNGITQQGVEERGRDQAGLRAGRFLRGSRVTHEVSLGVDVQETESSAQLQFPGTSFMDVDPQTGNPVTIGGQLFIDCAPFLDCLDFIVDGTVSGALLSSTGFDGRNGNFRPFLLWNFWDRNPRETTEDILAVYVSDEIVTGRWFINVGLRFEDFEAQDRSGGRLIDQQTVAPRLGLTYDLRGNGRTLLTASAGRYHEPFLQKFVDLVTRQRIFSGFTQYIFDELDPACTSVQAADPQSSCWILPVSAEPESETFTPIDADLDRSFVDEWVVGIEHQLSQNVGLSLHYVNRDWDDLWDDVFFVIRDDAGAPVDIGSEFRNIDFARREYQSVQLQVQRQYADRWQLLGSYTWSETEGNLFRNDGLSFFADFTDVDDFGIANRFGLAPYDREHQFKAFGNYQVPLGERLGLSIGAALRYESGIPFEQIDVDEQRFLTPRGSQRLGNLFQGDLSLSLDVPVARDFEFEIKAEVFNFTDEQEQIGVDRAVNFGTFGQPRSIFDIQSPRSYRLTVGLRF